MDTGGHIMGSDMALSQLWKSLIEVEHCFQNEILAQLQESNSFFDSCATPIKSAYLSFKTAEQNAHRSIKAAEPFLSRETAALAECAVSTAAKEFNSLIHLSRRAMILPDRQKAKRVMVSKRRRSLELFRQSVFSLKQGLSESVSDETGDSIPNMKCASGTPIVSAKRVNPPPLNLTLAELVIAIDKSDASVEKKNHLKRTIDGLVSDLVVTSILT